MMRRPVLKNDGKKSAKKTKDTAKCSLSSRGSKKRLNIALVTKWIQSPRNKFVLSWVFVVQKLHLLLVVGGEGLDFDRHEKRTICRSWTRCERMFDWNRARRRGFLSECWRMKRACVS